MLIKITKITEIEGRYTEADWFINHADVVAVYEGRECSKVAIRGFSNSISVTETVEEITDAIYDAQTDAAAAHWDAAIPALAQAIQYTAQDIRDGDVVAGDNRIDLRGLLRPVTGDGSGVIPITKGLRKQQADVQHD